MVGIGIIRIQLDRVAQILNGPPPVVEHKEREAAGVQGLRKIGFHAKRFGQFGHRLPVPALAGKLASENIVLLCGDSYAK